VLAGKFFPGTEVGQRAGVLFRISLKEADNWRVAQLAQENVLCLAASLLPNRVEVIYADA